VLGFAICLVDVLIKVSGSEKLAGDPRLVPYKSNAGNLVSAFSYHDRMSGISIHDEQGSRDRPYDLIVDFDQKKIDDLLGALDLKPWLGHRPVLAVFAGLQQGATTNIVTGDAERNVGQRESLLAAGAKRGVPVVLPTMAALEKSRIDGAKLSSVAPPTLASVAAGQGGEAVLVGQLVWVDRELGWATQWKMDWQGRSYRWNVRRVTFDEAFRRGMGGAAQVLSGNGDPQ